MRAAAEALGPGQADRRPAICDGGNGLEEAIHRNFDGGLPCTPDWHHAGRHLFGYAQAPHAASAVCGARAERAKGALYERGGAALPAHLREQPAPSEAAVADDLRKLIGCLGKSEHRTDYPGCRGHGRGIGSGPTEAGRKMAGAHDSPLPGG
jgi:hypothetical protein